LRSQLARLGEQTFTLRVNGKPNRGDSEHTREGLDPSSIRARGDAASVLRRATVLNRGPDKAAEESALGLE